MSRQRLFPVALTGLAFGLISACAGVKYQTINAYQTGDPAGDLVAEKKADDAADGIRYYEQVPYLLVYSDGKGGLKSQMLYLPDTTRKKVISPYAWMANNNLVLTLEGGILTQSSLTVDETAVPKALVDAAATALIAAADTGKSAGDKDEVPPPALYRIWVNADGSVELIGGYGTDIKGEKRQNLHATVSQPPEKAASDAAKPK